MIGSAAAVVVAAGRSSRMGGGSNKVLLDLNGRPVLSYCLQAFQSHDAITRVVVVGREEDRDAIQSIVDAYCPKARGHFVAGGAERFDSVRNGLEALADTAPSAVLIQDAARPFLHSRYIDDSLTALNEDVGCVIGVPLKDTLKETGDNHRIERTHDRSRFWLAQTPQTFRYPEILAAYRAIQPPPYPTDDGAVLEATGQPVCMALGSYQNIKITSPEDRAFAEALLKTATHTDPI